MEIAQVKQKIIHSFVNRPFSKFENSTAPHIISLLDLNKKQKAEAVERAFFDFIKGEEIVVLLSVSTSSKLFQYILKTVPTIWFIENKVIDQQNKRKDVIALLFTHQTLVT